MARIPLFLVAVALVAVSAAIAAESKPNVVLIFIDDMGYGDIGPFGSTKNRTPHLDRMAKEGMRLTSFYAAPVCSISRAQVMTGCYGQRVSIPGVFFPGCQHGISAAEHTVAELMKAQGYATMCIGKWHLGDQPEFLPTRHGFDRYFGLPYSNDMARKAKVNGQPVVPLVRDEKVIELLTGDDQDRLTERYTDEALKFIADNKDRPFFLYVPHTAVHVPIHPGEKFHGHSQNGRYGDWVEEVDWSVGRVLETLRALKLDRRTLVMFSSDNGPWLTHGADGGTAGPLRGGKGTTWEGGVREPTLAWWPGTIAPGSACDAIAGNIDFLPTFVKLAGGTVPADNKIDGKDISPLLLGKTKESPHEARYYYAGYKLQAVRCGPWKLAIAPQWEGRKKGEQAVAASMDKPRLYNLDTDIGERTDVAAEHPAVVGRLRTLAQKMIAQLGDGKPGPEVRPAGFVQNAVTLYPTDDPPRRPAAGRKKARGKSVSLDAAASKPNVVVVLADDLGYGDTGCYGATKIKTPNIDRLAQQGRRFTYAYTPGSVCSPTRYGLMAGRYCWREPRHHPTGVHAPGGPLLFDPDRLTLARLFQEHGYATGCVGKWHLGFGPGDNPRVRYDWSREEIKPGPLEVGFDCFYGMAANVGNQPRIYIENHRFVGRKPGDVVTMLGRAEVKPWSPEAEYKEDHVAGDIARKAVEFIERSKDKPFFLYFATNIAHNSITPAAEFAGSSACGPYGDFVQELDHHVGLVLAALDKAGIADNTLVLFTSDNGGVVADNERLAAQWQARQAGHAVCGSLRGRKHSIYEGGFRVPFIVRWPGHVPPGTQSDTMFCLTDVLAACASLLGDKLPEGAGEDSFNALPAWKGQPNARVRESLVLDSAQGIFAIREGDWKLIVRNDSLAAAGGKKTRQFAENENQLFNLADDPAETKNLWNEKPDVVKRLSDSLATLQKAGRSRP